MNSKLCDKSAARSNPEKYSDIDCVAVDSISSLSSEEADNNEIHSKKRKKSLKKYTQTYRPQWEKDVNFKSRYMFDFISQIP